ncbi:MAG: hypothetical protein FWG63_11930 [Defluviitaleaceae bacterium]|nr:hypothetical protein [Defluviitaleaceae bacterium]
MNHSSEKVIADEITKGISAALKNLPGDLKKLQVKETKFGLARRNRTCDCGAFAGSGCGAIVGGGPVLSNSAAVAQPEEKSNIVVDVVDVVDVKD